MVSTVAGSKTRGVLGGRRCRSGVAVGRHGGRQRRPRGKRRSTGNAGQQETPVNRVAERAVARVAAGGCRVAVSYGDLSAHGRRGGHGLDDVQGCRGSFGTAGTEGPGTGEQKTREQRAGAQRVRRAREAVRVSRPAGPATAVPGRRGIAAVGWPAERFPAPRVAPRRRSDGSDQTPKRRRPIVAGRDAEHNVAAPEQGHRIRTVLLRQSNGERRSSQAGWCGKIGLGEEILVVLCWPGGWHCVQATGDSTGGDRISRERDTPEQTGRH